MAAFLNNKQKNRDDKIGEGIYIDIEEIYLNDIRSLSIRLLIEYQNVV